MNEMILEMHVLVVRKAAAMSFGMGKTRMKIVAVL